MHKLFGFRKVLAQYLPSSLMPFKTEMLHSIYL